MPKSRPSKKPAARAAPEERVNLCENNVASACSGPVFCVNCGMTEHSASQCQNVPVHEDLAYSLWAEQPFASQTMSDSEMVLMLRPAEAAHVATPLTVTCGKKSKSRRTQSQLLLIPRDALSCLPDYCRRLREKPAQNPP